MLEELCITWVAEMNREEPQFELNQKTKHLY